jgi:SAM-dependent methyltransferase
LQVTATTLPSEAEALDAYSRVVTHVAELLAPSVANLRVVRRGRMVGAGSGVVITPDGFLLTSAHVVEAGTRVRGSFTDGRELSLRPVGADALSDLAVLRAEDAVETPPVELGDAAALAYADESFDSVLVFQSLQHAGDRGQWLREAVRVLRPGGRMVLTEFVEEIPLTPEEVEILLDGATHPPLPYSDLLELIRASGLVVDEAVGCGDHIRRSYPAYFDRLDRSRSYLVETFGEERVDQWREAMATLLPVYRDKIGYVVVTGHRPRA